MAVVETSRAPADIAGAVARPWLFFSWSFPPAATAMSTVHRNLLAHLEQEKVHVLAAARPRQAEEAGERLACHVHVAEYPLPWWVRGQIYLTQAWIPWI